MPNVANQKLKQLYLMKILLEQTDEEHPMSVKDLIEQLSLYGISAERKSLYVDIERLADLGINVMSKKTKTVGYFVTDFFFGETLLPSFSIPSWRATTCQLFATN